MSVCVCERAYMCVLHKFPSWPAGQEWRNEQSVGVKDKPEGAGSRRGMNDGH